MPARKEYDVLPLLPPTLEALNITTKKLLDKDVFVAGRGGSRDNLWRGGRGVYCSGLKEEARFASSSGVGGSNPPLSAANPLTQR